MKIKTSYKVKIKNYNKIFNDTLRVYRDAVAFLIDVCLKEWDDITSAGGGNFSANFIEHLINKTSSNLSPKYPAFNKKFYKFPAYLRRAAISDAIGRVSSYKSNLLRWERAGRPGREPGVPKAGRTFPCYYKGNMYEKLDTYKAKIKIYIRNTWDWLEIDLKKSDIDYINKYCLCRKSLNPTLEKCGKQWFLTFPFEEQTELKNPGIFNQTILAVDLGLNNSAAVSVLKSDGTVTGRHILSLPTEYDCLKHAINRIKKAQSRGARHTPRLWGVAKGINDDIAVKTAKFIMQYAVLYDVDIIVFEHLDISGKKYGKKKQKLHLWKCQYVQNMVTDKSHRACMRVSRVNAAGTSKLAFDGSGEVKRGNKAGLASYNLCKFTSGKIYNSNLSASYNIGSRYFIREILKSLPEKERLSILAKVQELDKRSTCTLSTLINLNVVLTV